MPPPECENLTASLVCPWTQIWRQKFLDQINKQKKSWKKNLEKKKLERKSIFKSVKSPASRKENVQFSDSPDFKNLPDFRQSPNKIGDPSSLNTQSCIRRPLCSTLKSENLSKSLSKIHN